MSRSLVVSLVVVAAACGGPLESPEERATTHQELRAAQSRLRFHRPRANGEVMALAMPFGFHLLTASFSAGPRPDTSTVIAGSRCEFFDGAAVVVQPPISAGTVHVIEGSAPAIDLVPDSAGVYAPSFQMSPLAPHTQLRFVVDGQHPVAATSDTAVMPAQTTITAPAFATGPGLELIGAPVVDRSTALEFTWSAANASTDSDFVVELLAGPLANGTPDSIRCAFPLNRGRGLIPARALGRLPAGPASLILGAESIERDTRRGTDLRVRAVQAGPQGNLTLQ